jgi:hypothetical protein
MEKLLFGVMTDFLNILKIGVRQDPDQRLRPSLTRRTGIPGNQFSPAILGKDQN